MEQSRAYQGLVVSKIIGCTPQDLEELSAMDYLKVTNIIKGFFEALEYQELMGELLEK